MRGEICYAGYSIVSSHKIIEVQALPPIISAQLAELIALTRALELRKEKRLKICTNSKYAFFVLHAHAAIWKKKGYLNAKLSHIKCVRCILQSLEGRK